MSTLHPLPAETECPTAWSTRLTGGDATRECSGQGSIANTLGQADILAVRSGNRILTVRDLLDVRFELLSRSLKEVGLDLVEPCWRRRIEFSDGSLTSGLLLGQVSSRARNKMSFRFAGPEFQSEWHILELLVVELLTGRIAVAEVDLTADIYDPEDFSETDNLGIQSCFVLIGRLGRHTDGNNVDLDLGYSRW